MKNGNWLATVPNNEEGKLFVALLKKYSNPRIWIRRRGRGKRYGGQDVRIENAEQLAIYLQSKNEQTIIMKAPSTNLSHIEPMCSYYDYKRGLSSFKFSIGNRYYNWICENSATFPCLFFKPKECGTCEYKYKCLTGGIEWNIFNITKGKDTDGDFASL